MENVSIIGLDLAKNVFQAHGARADGSTVFRKKVSRAKLLSFFASVPKCVVAMEACASAHYWARQIGALGHEVRLIAPIYVKPFVKRNKNDAADAEAIAEAACRPTMRFVAVKSVEKQASGMASRRATCLSVNEPKRSTLCADIWRNTASWPPKDPSMSNVSPRLCKIRAAVCRLL
jgi:transposase